MTVLSELRACKKLPPEEAAKVLMEIVKANFTLPELPKDAEWNSEKKQRYYAKGHRFDLGAINETFSKAFKKLGDGAFSSAYHLRRGWVIKTNDNCWLDSPTDGWFDWAKVMIENQDNPFLTKFAALERHDSFFIAITERLEHDSSANPGGWPLEQLYMAHKQSGENIDWKQSLEQIQSFGLNEMVKRDRKSTLDLACLLFQTKEILKSRLDCHGENTMVRKNGWPVLNDPFPDSYNTSLSKKGTFSWARAVA